MKRIVLFFWVLVPTIMFAQKNGTGVDTSGSSSLTELVFADRIYHIGDTVVNLNSLNNGIKTYQVSDESKKAIANNGLELKEGAVVILKEDSLLKSDFSFDIKTHASDQEWYENTVKIKVKDHDIRLINVTSDKIEMATGFRKEGKIYVVVTVSIILFFTVIIYLIYLERKTKKLEKQLQGK